LFSGKDNISASFSGRLLDGFQAELVNSDTGRKTRVDITDSKSRYIENGVYSTEGKLLKSITPKALPNSSIEPIDLNHDGTYELKGVQKIVGTSSADVVAQVYSYWQYASSQRWTLQQLEVASLLLGLSQEALPNSVPPDQAVSKQMKSEYADVSYPQFTEMSSLLTRDYVNQALETAARELVNHATSDSHVIAEYEVTRSDGKMLSVIFKNSQKQEKGESPILQSINIDLKNRAIVSAVDLFRSDRQSRRSIDSLIADAAKQANMPDAPTLSDSMGVYITNQEIVLYAQLSDDKSETARLYLPLEKAKPYLKEPFAPSKSS
jgi:hypothetical protein